MDIERLFAARNAERYDLHARYLNEQMVRVLKTIGFDRAYKKGKGQYLYGCQGEKYLDLLSGLGVFGLGRNHPVVRDALKQVLDGDLPNLVQMDVSALAGVLAERLLRHVPHLEKAFFVNSGTESVEAAMKFSRAATGRSGIVYCDHAFHGLTYGALSLNGDEIFRTGFEPLLPDCVEVRFNDLAALEQALSSRKVAAFIVEPIQGKGVIMPDDDYLQSAQATLPQIRHAVHRRRDADRPRPHRAVPRRRALGRRGRHRAAGKAAVGRPCPRWRGADAQMDFRQGVRPHGPRRGSRLDLRQKRSGHGRGSGNARGHAIRAADRRTRPTKARVC